MDTRALARRISTSSPAWSGRETWPSIVMRARFTFGPTRTRMRSRAPTRSGRKPSEWGQMGFGGLGEESQAPEVHPEDRNVGARRFARRGEKGAVAAQDQDGIDARDQGSQGHSGAHPACSARDALLEEDLDLMFPHPARERGNQRPR